MARVAKSTEKELKKHEKFLPNRLFANETPVSHAVCTNAAQLARMIDADLIVTITKSGFTAQQISKHRIYIPLIAITDESMVQRQLQLTWGIRKVLLHDLSKTLSPSDIKNLLIKKQIAKKKQKIVLVSNASTDEKTISTIIV